MKKNVVICLSACLALTCGVVMADNVPGHQHGAAPSTASSQDDVKTHASCAHCGMNREMFSHSRMLITYADGTSVGTCSINCVVAELKANKGKAVASVTVGDYDTRKLLNAEKAFWVIGGDKRGVMTKTPKWAFATKAAAEVFIKKHGGKLATYKDALALAEKD